MTVESIMAELKAKGNESAKVMLKKHGIKEPFFGTRISDMQVIRKKVKTDYQLAKDLYATGNTDAMYLAGLIADEKKMTKADLSAWVKKAESTNICEYTVPWIAAESRFGFEMALEWVESKKDFIAAAGWAALSNVVALKPDTELDLATLKKLLKRVEKEIRSADTRIRYRMNSFLIAIGSYVLPLSDEAIAAAKRIGPVTAVVEGTACKVPAATEYIMKVKNKGSLGKKKKMVRC